ncbi:MAG TPA: hypothetical protein VFS43_13020 [Polyangiaceae bacterium]|nr:hypothetical protein [Polyangiaceae bacterium]
MFIRTKAAARGPLLAAVALSLPLSLVAPSLLSACGGDDDDDGGAAGSGAEGQAPPVVAESAVVFQGGPTDETLRAMVGVPPRADDARAAALVAPAAGETMSAATPPTFRWAAPTARAPGAEGASLWARARAALGERQAHAHGTPYSGVAYLLSIASPSGTALLTTLTSETSFTPDAAAWAAVAGAGGEVRVYLLTARCEQNAVVGGGPFAPAAGPVALRVGP